MSPVVQRILMTNLLGAILVSQFQRAAMERADTPEEEREDFFLAIDEFHNFTTDAFAAMLSEIRKYRLSMTLLSQYLDQLSVEVRDAVFGNVGSLLAFRVGEKDAAILAREFGGAYKPHWFVLAQTEGADYVPADLPEWSEGRTLTALSIERVMFDHPNGNVQGFARERKVSVSPIAAQPHKTLFHELAHVVLGHTEELTKLDDHDATPVNLREVEAECVALICCESLGLSGGEFCCG